MHAHGGRSVDRSFRDVVAESVSGFTSGSRECEMGRVLAVFPCHSRRQSQ